MSRFLYAPDDYGLQILIDDWRTIGINYWFYFHYQLRFYTLDVPVCSKEHVIVVTIQVGKAFCMLDDGMWVWWCTNLILNQTLVCYWQLQHTFLCQIQKMFVTLGKIHIGTEKDWTYSIQTHHLSWTSTEGSFYDIQDQIYLPTQLPEEQKKIKFWTSITLM